MNLYLWAIFILSVLVWAFWQQITKDNKGRYKIERQKERRAIRKPETAKETSHENHPPC